MSLLDEVAAKAKREGSFTEEWAKLRNLHFGGDLKDNCGIRDMQKLKAWAESQDLIMKFDFAFDGFSAGIRTVTFLPKA